MYSWLTVTVPRVCPRDTALPDGMHAIASEASGTPLVQFAAVSQLSVLAAPVQTVTFDPPDEQTAGRAAAC